MDRHLVASVASVLLNDNTRWNEDAGFLHQNAAVGALHVAGARIYVFVCNSAHSVYG